MTDVAQQNTAAYEKLRAFLTGTYNTLSPDRPRIDTVELDTKGHVVIIGANPDESLLHSRTGRTPVEVLESYESRL